VRGRAPAIQVLADAMGPSVPAGSSSARIGRE